jgi:hypothetical protein
VPPRLREWLFVCLLTVGVTVFATWPIAARFGSAGRLDSGDGRFSVWNVAWVAHALTSSPADIWNANIFYPHQQTLGYSEANLLAGALAAPVWVATHNPYAASNWTIVCAFVLSAISMYVLARRLTGSRAAAAVSALIYAFCPYAFSHLTHVQLLMTFAPVVVLIGMHAFVDAPSVRSAAMLGVALAIAALASGYYGIFGGLAVGWGVIWFGAWQGHWRRPRYWALALLALVVALAIVSPVIGPYIRIHEQGFDRTLDDARVFRAGWRAYLASPKFGHQWVLDLIGHWREVLFPGYIAVTLSAIALVAARRPESLPVAPRVFGFYVTLALLALWASLGPDAGLYAAIYRVVPFASMLRAPARLGLLVTLAFAVIAGVGYLVIARRLTGAKRRVFAIAMISLAIIRSSAGPLALVDAPPTPSAYAWLRTLPRGPVAEFPFFSDSADRSRQTEYMLMSTLHWQPLINGYSDFIPDDEYRDMPRLATFPDLDAWRVLHDRGARYVVIHWDMYDEATKRTLRPQLRRLANNLSPLVDDGRVALFQIVGWPTGVETKPGMDGPAPSR